MKELLRFGLILASICVIASGLLASVNSLTKPKIAAQLQLKEKSGLSELFPQANNFAAVRSQDEIIYYKVYTDDRLSAFVFKTEAKGYSANPIEILVGMNLQGKISQIKILSQSETPGLGSQISEDSFTARFNNVAVWDLAKVEAITGATISSKATIDAVKKKAEEIQSLLKNAK